MAIALKDVSINPNIRVEENGSISYAVSCRHCEEPYCVKGCITGALKKVDGVIKVDKSRCVGCYTCISSCPYGAIKPTEVGPIQKCELCTGTSNKTPKCVEGCPNGAIVFEER